MKRSFLLGFFCATSGALGLLATSSCTGDDTAVPMDGGMEAGKDGTLDAPTDAGKDVQYIDGSVDGTFCRLPGSVVWDQGSPKVVAGGPPSPDMTWLKVPDGFCVHYYANVGNARQIKFAPGGELFVASPTTGTTGGGQGGKSAVVIFPDDNHDGYGDAMITFLSGLPSTQGILFSHDGYFYFQDHTLVMRLPYKSGDRAPAAMPKQVIDVASVITYQSAGHWPKVLDEADDGTIFVTNGGDQGETCDPMRPFHGGIVKLAIQGDGTAIGTPIVKGLRNPIGIRCTHGNDHCFALELSLDYSSSAGGREKLIPVRDGDDWGYPCCATKDLPYMGVFPVPDCSKVALETDSFIIGRTPFDLDYDRGLWPSPWNKNFVVSLHGDFGTWQGARVVGIQRDPGTGDPVAGSELTMTGIADFATGWDDGKLDHGRPDGVAFAADGRMFLSNDVSGDIVWIAPVGMDSDAGVVDSGTDGGAGDASTDASDAASDAGDAASDAAGD